MKPKATAKEDKVPIHEKALYGLGSPSMMITNNVVENQIQQVLVFGMGMSPAMKSLIVMIFRLWDAFIDPLMGWVSDNTRSKWGRRRPYMFAGCLLMAIIMPFIWRFSEAWDMTWIAVWMTIGGILLSTATTIYNIPYQTLKMEMTPDYNERTSVNVYSGVIIKCFSMVFPWIWLMSQHPFFTGQAVGEEPNTLLGIRNIAIWFAMVVIIIGMVPVFVCKERYYANASKQKKEPFWASLKCTFKDRPFKMLLLFMLFLNLESLVTGMGAYVGLYYVWGGDKTQAAVFTGIAGTSAMVLALLSIPLYGWLARRFGKERSLLLVVIGQIAMAASIPFVYNPEIPWLVVIPQVVNGILIAGLWTIVPAMKADIVDHDELHTHERREGSFESVFSWFLKLSSTIFGAFSGFIVVFLGFNIDLGPAQAEGVFSRIIFLLAAVPFTLSVIEAYIIYKWPLTPGRMEEIRGQLEAQRGKINPVSESDEA